MSLLIQKMTIVVALMTWTGVVAAEMTNVQCLAGLRNGDVDQNNGIDFDEYQVMMQNYATLYHPECVSPTLTQLLRTQFIEAACLCQNYTPKILPQQTTNETTTTTTTQMIPACVCSATENEDDATRTTGSVLFPPKIYPMDYTWTLCSSIKQWFSDMCETSSSSTPTLSPRISNVDMTQSVEETTPTTNHSTNNNNQSDDASRASVALVTTTALTLLAILGVIAALYIYDYRRRGRDERSRSTPTTPIATSSSSKRRHPNERRRYIECDDDIYDFLSSDIQQEVVPAPPSITTTEGTMSRDTSFEISESEQKQQAHTTKSDANDDDLDVQGRQHGVALNDEFDLERGDTNMNEELERIESEQTETMSDVSATNDDVVEGNVVDLSDDVDLERSESELSVSKSGVLTTNDDLKVEGNDADLCDEFDLERGESEQTDLKCDEMATNNEFEVEGNDADLNESGTSFKDKFDLERGDSALKDDPDSVSPFICILFSSECDDDDEETLPLFEASSCSSPEVEGSSSSEDISPNTSSEWDEFDLSQLILDEQQILDKLRSDDFHLDDELDVEAADEVHESSRHWGPIDIDDCRPVGGGNCDAYDDLDLSGPIDVDDCTPLVDSGLTSTGLRCTSSSYRSKTQLPRQRKKKSTLTKVRSVKRAREAYMKQAETRATYRLKPIPEATLTRAKLVTI